MAKFKEEVSVKLNDKFSPQSKKLIKANDSMVSSFKGLGAALVAAFSISKVVGFVKDSVKAFGEEEKAIKRLETSLKLLNITSASTTKSFTTQAKELQVLTGVSNDAIIAQQAFLTSVKFTKQEVDDIIEASIDLSAATGLTLEGAVRNLAKTFSGLSGELGELIPQLRDVTAEELKAGEGVKLIGKLFKGIAEDEAKTFAGQLIAVGNTFVDVSKKIGALVAESEKFNNIVTFINTNLTKLDKALGDAVDPQIQLQKSIEGTKNEIIFLEAVIERLAKPGGGLLNKWQIGSNKEELERLQAVLRGFEIQLKGLVIVKEKDEKLSAKQIKRSKDLKKSLQDEAEKRKDLEALYTGSLGKLFLLDDANKDLMGSSLGLTDSLSTVSSTLGLTDDNLLKATDSISALGSQISPLVGAMFKASGTIAGIGASIISFFDGDVRSVFTRLTDDISAINNAIDASFRRLDDLRSEEAKREARRVVDVKDTAGLLESGAGKGIRADIGANVGSFFKGGFRVEVDPENGDVRVVRNGDKKVIGFIRGDTGETVVENIGISTTDAKAKAFINEIVSRATNIGLDTSTESEESSLSRSSPRTGTSPLGTSTLSETTSSFRGRSTEGFQNITINAMDSKSFEDFMRGTGAQVFRRLTRNNGLVLTSGRGVSSNA